MSGHGAVDAHKAAPALSGIQCQRPFTIAEFVPTSQTVHRPPLAKPSSASASIRPKPHPYARTGVKNHGWGHRSPKSPDRIVIGDSKRPLSRRDFPWGPARRSDVAYPNGGAWLTEDGLWGTGLS